MPSNRHKFNHSNSKGVAAALDMVEQNLNTIERQCREKENRLKLLEKPSQSRPGSRHIDKNMLVHGVHEQQTISSRKKKNDEHKHKRDKVGVLLNKEFNREIINYQNDERHYQKKIKLKSKTNLDEARYLNKSPDIASTPSRPHILATRKQPSPHLHRHKRQIRRKVTVPASLGAYAHPTLASQLKIQSTQTENIPTVEIEKENKYPFIPSGSDNKCYHLGIVTQQFIGKQNLQPLKLAKTGIEWNTGVVRSDNVVKVSADDVKKAMININQQISVVKKATKKKKR